ncbi:MAG: DUF1552 domain-containing protein [Bacteroidota bacterium]
MKPFTLSRRAVLRGAGGITVGLPFLDLMRPAGRRAWGAGSGPTKRFIVFFSPDGSIHENWVPTGTESAFTLSRILAPLEAHKQKLVVLEGVENKVGGYGAKPGDDHMKGMGAMLTGMGLLAGTTQGGAGDPAGLAAGISVDQTIANAIGADTKFRSLELGVQAGSSGTVWGYSNYIGPGQALPLENNPTAVFNRVFASQAGGSAALAKQRAERKSVLDAVSLGYTRLGARLGADDKAKLDAHLAHIRDLEVRLTAADAACASPAAPAAIDHKANANFPAVGKLQMDLLVTALACDLTRVGTIQWEQSVGNVRFTWVDPAITRGHHDLSHDGDSVAATIEQLTKINIWYAQQFSYLLDALKNTKEADGTSMLDNTLVLWVNELARGNAHSHDKMPYVLAGGAGGALRTGRFLTYKGVSHNNLLVSCMNLMGVPGTTFGNPAFCTGPLANL